MSKSLIIAEKPSVAQDIVRALTPVDGRFDKHDEYFESEHYVVTSAVGHLLEIRDGFEHLRSDQEMLPLASAARCRSEADWLVGINGTRAMTAFNSRDGGFFLTTVGRVQTPTLSIMVDREEKIRKHVARDYWE